MSVTEILDRLEELNKQITEVATAREDDATAQIIGLRQEFAAECGNLLKAMCNDDSIFGDSDLFSTLQNDLEQMRARLSGHQLHWQSGQIERDYPAYCSASEKVSAAISDFVSETLKKLPEQTS